MSDISSVTGGQGASSMRSAHHCLHEVCGKWGGFGFDRVEARVKTTDWWCWEHYPYKDIDEVLRARRRQ